MYQPPGYNYVQQQPPKGQHRWLWSLLLIPTLGFFACFNRASRDYDAERSAQSALFQAVDQIHLYTERRHVIDQIGEPDREQILNAGGYNEEIIDYYGPWQLVFENGRLTSKNKY